MTTIIGACVTLLVVFVCTTSSFSTELTDDDGPELDLSSFKEELDNLAREVDRQEAEKRREEAEKRRDAETKDYKLALEEYFLGKELNAKVKGRHRFSKTEVQDEMMIKAAKKFLFKFGYKRSFSGEIQESMIKKFQRNANIEETGKLDQKTMIQMTKPRCSNQDPDPDRQVRMRRYVHQGTRWADDKISKPLTWKLENTGGQRFTADEVKGVMRQAFAKWSALTNIDFEECPTCEGEAVNIWVVFRKYGHEDAYSFDGPGGTLAHAFYPHNNKGLSGDVHFDDSERFTIGSKDGRSLLFVATHELGHSLGMEHSNDKAAVMYPWYQPYDPAKGVNLHYDDKVGIQSLYGSRTRPQPTPKPQPTAKPTEPKPKTTQKPVPIPSDRECPERIDAAMYLPRYGAQILFTDAKPLERNPDKLMQNIIIIRNGKASSQFSRESYFPTSRIPGNIDAAVTMKGVRTARMNAYFNFIFSGSEYYLYEGLVYRAGPFSIHEDLRKSRDPKVKAALKRFNLLNLQLPKEFPNGPDGMRNPYAVKKIDGTMLFRNGRLYLFAGTHYYRYYYNPEKRENQMDGGYLAEHRNDTSGETYKRGEKTIKWGWGMIDHVDSLFTHKSLGTLFLKDKKIFKLDNKSIRLARGYPQHVGLKWLNCGGRDALSRLQRFSHRSRKRGNERRKIVNPSPTNAGGK